jgi:hypothetical protein
MTGAVTSIPRSQFKSFLNTGTSLSPVWSPIGTGVTTAKIAYNPKTLQEIYITDNTGTTEVESYMPNFPVEMTAKVNDPVFEFVDALRRSRAILADAHANMVNVWLYETAVGGAYPAENQSVSIQVENTGGDGGTVLKLNYQINFLGAPVLGTFNPSTGTFTANP